MAADLAIMSVIMHAQPLLTLQYSCVEGLQALDK